MIVIEIGRNRGAGKLLKRPASTLCVQDGDIQVRGSKTRSRTRKLDIAPELQAPITREIERQLQELVAQLGEKKVLEALDPLVTKCKWNDCQCVANAIRRIARHRQAPNQVYHARE
jgi:hypothetical protein